MIHNLGRFIYLIRCRIRQNIKTITKDSQDYILVNMNSGQLTGHRIASTNKTPNLPIFT